MEAYGMGGDDYFYVRGRWPGGATKINGGAGYDTINTRWMTKLYKDREDREIVLSGGGPEIDKVVGGKANEFVVMEQDEVSDEGGNNTLFLKRGGHDVLLTGPGAGLIVVNKTSGATHINPYDWPSIDVIQKPKRIVYKSGRLTNPYPLTLFTTANKARKKDALDILMKYKNKPFIIKGSKTPHDVVSTTNFKPVQSSSSSSSDPMVVLIPNLYSEPKNLFELHFAVVTGVHNELFTHTLCFDKSASDADPPVYRPKGDERALISRNQIERFELSEHATNLVILGCGTWDKRLSRVQGTST